MSSLINADNTWALWAVIVTGTTTAIWLEQSYNWAAKLSGPVLALLIAMILSNVGVMPTDAPSYAFVGEYLVPLAIPLLLLRANLLRIAKETGPVFAYFHFSVIGTIAGAALATLLLKDKIEHVGAVAAIMTASYTGGAVNFFAVRESFHVSENLTNPLLVADNFIMAGMFVLLLTVAGNARIQRYFRAREGSSAQDSDKPATVSEHWRPKQIGLADIAKSLAIAVSIVAVAHGTGRAVLHYLEPSVVTAVISNEFVLITFFSMLVATVMHRTVEKINGGEELGTFMLYIFLFAIGLPADLLAVLQNMPLLFLFCLIMALTNLVVTLLLGSIFKADLRELVVCVSATLGGPPTAVAMAIAKGWSDLVVPAVLVGIWGYVIGTFLGVLLGELLTRFV